jgi:hypothetical protein
VAYRFLGCVRESRCFAAHSQPNVLWILALDRGIGRTAQIPVDRQAAPCQFLQSSQAMFAGSQANTSLTWGLSRSCHQAAQVPSSRARAGCHAHHGQTGELWRFQSENGFHHQFACRIQNSNGDRCLVIIQPDMLGIIIHEGAHANDQTYSKRAPAMMRSSGPDFLELGGTGEAQGPSRSKFSPTWIPPAGSPPGNALSLIRVRRWSPAGRREIRHGHPLS